MPDFDFSRPMDLALLALAMPLLASLTSLVLGLVQLPKLAHLPAIFGFAAASVLSLIVLSQTASGDTPLEFHTNLGTWFSVNRLNVEWTFLLDPLSIIMLCTVTFIATWIAVFSASYMHGDPGYARYFAVMGLFVFAMALLILADNFFLLLAGWEGVGLCSYLLVGYYYAKPAAAAAARKALLVTRLGDVGMILGFFLLWRAGGYHTNMNELFEYLQIHSMHNGALTTALLLLFCGAIGKSAQLPLYVWLPDAMEGPTPVSALIHAATMVTAGVYLLARFAPLFVLCPDVQIIVALIGATTALLAAFIALTQTDLKRVLAYSTVSQLGYMFMALGCSGVVSPYFAVTAAIFHLFTHAFFKALLFLGSGSVMHAMGNVIDMRKFGGLRKLMPVTHITFLIGSAALAGVPLLSGFWSKDQILHALLESSEIRLPFRDLYLLVFVLATLTAFLTAFYTFRAYFLTFWGQERIPAEAHGHAHESPRMMTWPLIVLAVGALAVGAIVDPLTHWFGHFMERSPGMRMAEEGYLATTNLTEQPHEFSWSVAMISMVVAGAGIAIAFGIYRNGGPVAVPGAIRSVHSLSSNKLYVDEIYGATVVTPAEITATASRQMDSFLDALARLTSFLPRIGAAVLRPLQNGLVQFYALGMILGLAVFLTVVVVRSIR